MSLNIESLRCFAEAARRLNFRAAARAVHLSPAALGQRIRQVEDELGVELFHRTTRAVFLTEHGLALLPYAEKAIASVEDCRLVSRGELGAPTIELTLGTRHELGLSWVVPMLERLERDLAGVTMHLYFGSGPDLLSRVRSAAIDCAVTSTRITDPKLDGIRIHDERYVFVGKRELLCAHPLSTAKDASQHTLFDATEELPLFRYLRDGSAGIDSVAFRRVVLLGTIAAIRHEVLRGKGVAVLPQYFVQDDLGKDRLVQIFPKRRPLADVFRLVFRVDDPRRSLYARLAELMQSEPLR